MPYWKYWDNLKLYANLSVENLKINKKIQTIRRLSFLRNFHYLVSIYHLRQPISHPSSPSIFHLNVWFAGNRDATIRELVGQLNSFVPYNLVLINGKLGNTGSGTSLNPLRSCEWSKTWEPALNSELQEGWHAQIIWAHGGSWVFHLSPCVGVHIAMSNSFRITGGNGSG